LDGQFGKGANRMDISDEKLWTALTSLKHLDSLSSEVAAEWHKKGNDKDFPALEDLIESCRISRWRNWLARTDRISFVNSFSVMSRVSRISG
jgi:hypothetical protein